MDSGTWECRHMPNFRGNEDLCKLGKKIFKRFAMQVRPFLSTTFQNFWHITCLSTGNRRWVINAQTGPVFLAHPVEYILMYTAAVSQANAETRKLVLWQSADVTTYVWGVFFVAGRTLLHSVHIISILLLDYVLTLDREIHGASNRNHCHVVDALTLILSRVLILNVVNRQLMAKAFKPVSHWHLFTNSLPRHTRRGTATTRDS